MPSRTLKPRRPDVCAVNRKALRARETGWWDQAGKTGRVFGVPRARGGRRQVPGNAPPDRETAGASTSGGGPPARRASRTRAQFAEAPAAGRQPRRTTSASTSTASCRRYGTWTATGSTKHVGCPNHTRLGRAGPGALTARSSTSWASPSSARTGGSHGAARHWSRQDVLQVEAEITRAQSSGVAERPGYGVGSAGAWVKQAVVLDSVVPGGDEGGDGAAHGVGAGEVLGNVRMA
jgi:hypothetical protein